LITHVQITSDRKVRSRTGRRVADWLDHGLDHEIDHAGRMMTGESAVARLGRAGTRSTDAYMHAEIREKALAQAAPSTPSPAANDPRQGVLEFLESLVGDRARGRRQDQA
jgi:hypothetical protein